MVCLFILGLVWFGLVSSSFELATSWSLRGAHDVVAFLPCRSILFVKEKKKKNERIKTKTWFCGVHGETVRCTAVMALFVSQSSYLTLVQSRLSFRTAKNISFGSAAFNGCFG